MSTQPVEVAADSTDFGASWWKTMLCTALPDGVEPRGIIYAGAHVGEHVGLFAACGFRSILALEPNVAAFRELQQVASRFEGVTCLNVAAGDQDGVTPYFRVSDIPTLNSTLEPDTAYWLKLVGSQELERHPVERLEVPLARLDTLLPAGKPHPYHVLYINTQGSEIQVLRGAERMLPDVEVIFTEVNFVRRYEGCATFAEVDAFLTQRGFAMTYLRRYQDSQYTHGEAIYSRSAARLIQEYSK